MTDRKPKFRRRAEARPDEVLDAALALFIDKGYESTRVDDIARRAGISKGAVYLYFQSKQAILEGLIQRAVVPVADRVAATALASDQSDPRALVASLMHLFAHSVAQPETFAIPKVVIREAIVVPEIADMYRHAVIDRVFPVAVDLIRRGIESGHFRPVDPELTIRSIVGPLLMHLLMGEIFGLGGGGADMDEMVQNHLTILFDGLSGGDAK